MAQRPDRVTELPAPGDDAATTDGTTSHDGTTGDDGKDTTWRPAAVPGVRAVDESGQPLDRSGVNSWSRRLGQVGEVLCCPRALVPSFYTDNASSRRFLPLLTVPFPPPRYVPIPSPHSFAPIF